VTIGPFLFDGPTRPVPFFDGPHTGWAKTDGAGLFATPTCGRHCSWSLMILTVLAKKDSIKQN